MKRKYDENKCVASLARNHKVRLVMAKHIQLPKENTIGIHSWGMIDYLVNYCGYVYTYYDNTRNTSAPIKKNRHKKSNKYQIDEEA